jgi:Collagen triple helix repeat (20 copies)/Carbohydrate-binding module family 5/12
MKILPGSWPPAATLASYLAIFFAIPNATGLDALLLQDAYVDNGTPFQTFLNYGNSGDLRVFKNGNHSMRSLLKFTLETLPPGTTAANVTQARLRLWVNSNTLTLGSITMTPITSPWDELTLRNINTGGMTFGLPKLIGLPINSSSDFVSIDVTSWVKAWIAGSLVNEGFQIEAGAAATTLDLYFDSKEATQTSHEPRLEITLDSIGPQGPVGPQGPQGPIGPMGPQGPVGPLGMTGAQGPVGPAGATGRDGPVGPIGPQGLVGPPGPPGLNWKRQWNSSTAYVANDIVFFEGSTYTALQANTNVQPPGPGTWDLLAQKGDAGAIGSQGPVGPAGQDGASGSVGPKGEMGPQGPEGPTGPVGPPGAAGREGPAGPPAVWPTHILPQGDLPMGEFTQGTPP